MPRVWKAVAVAAVLVSTVFVGMASLSIYALNHVNVEIVGIDVGLGSLIVHVKIANESPLPVEAERVWVSVYSSAGKLVCRGDVKAGVEIEPGGYDTVAVDCPVGLGAMLGLLFGEGDVNVKVRVEASALAWEREATYGPLKPPADHAITITAEKQP